MTRSALVAVVLVIAGCRGGSDPTGPLEIVDTASGTVVDRWPAPRLAFDVAVDDATGRVWVVAEDETDGIARVFEAFPDRPSEIRYELHPGADGPGGTGYLGLGKGTWTDAGAIALDPDRRRGLFGSPGSDEMVLLDIDTGEKIHSVFGGSWGYPLGTAFDLERGIAYGVVSGANFRLNAEDGGDVEIYPFPWWSMQGMVISAATDRAFFSPSVGSVADCSVVTGECGPELPVWCKAGVYDCDVAGLAVAADGRRFYVSAPSLTQGVTVTPSIPNFVIWKIMEPMSDASQRLVLDPSGPHGFELSPDDSTLYVTEVRCNRISVYHAKTGEHLYDIPMRGETMGIDLTADGSQLYVTTVDPRSPLGRGREYLPREIAGPCPELKRREE